MMRDVDGAGRRRRRSCACGHRRARRCCSSARSRPTIEDLTARAARSTRSPASTRPGRGATSPATTTWPSGCPRSRSAPSSSPPGCRSPSAARSLAPGLVKARWSDDAALTARINPEVAHYTGQAELASVIQEGLAAKAAGDEATATVKLGRAVAARRRRPATRRRPSRLRSVVEIDDEEQGTVRLKRNADKLDEMALDTASTKTTRVRR